MGGSPRSAARRLRRPAKSPRSGAKRLRRPSAAPPGTRSGPARRGNAETAVHPSGCTAARLTMAVIWYLRSILALRERCTLRHFLLVRRPLLQTSGGAPGAYHLLDGQDEAG